MEKEEHSDTQPHEKKEKDWGENISVVRDAEEKDQDIDIDVGKVFGFLKGKKTVKEVAHEPKVSEHAAESNDEVDLGKAVAGIKGMFKGVGKEKKEHGSDADSVDIAGAVQFVKTHKPMLLLILAIVFSIGIGTQIRMQAGDLGITDSWALNNAYSTIEQDVNSVISQQYPNLPAERRQALLTKELQDAIESGTYTFKKGQFAGQTMSIEQQTEQISQSIKSFFQDEKGKNYMPDIDTYYWYRYAQNYAETGHVGDEVRDGVEWDMYQLAPIGRPIPQQDTFYPKIISISHSLFGWVHGGGLQRTQMFLPVLFSALTTLFVFLITRRIAGTVAAFFAATMVSVHGSLLSRSIFGHADSDSLVVLFSVLILWLFTESFAVRRIGLRLGYAALAGVATGMYSLVWGGWWWIFDFILASFAASLSVFIAFEAYTACKGTFSGRMLTEGVAALKKLAVRQALASGAMYFAVTGMLVSAFFGVKIFVLTPVTSLGFASIKTPVLGDVWPNVLRTVAELNEGSISSGINQIGSSLFWVAIILGIGGIILRAAITAHKKEDSRSIFTDLFSAVLLSLWLAATLYSVTKGIRFVLLLVPAFSIAFGVAFGLVHRLISWYASKEFKLHQFGTQTVLFVMLFAVFPGLLLNSNIVKASQNVAHNDIPIVNDAWYNALTSIEDQSDQNAIITSWWDFGHHFKAIADRPVTFDGTTQQTERAHWVGRLFMTSDENEAIGILRLLDCSGGEAVFDINNSKYTSIVPSIGLLKQLILLDREEAETRLIAEGFSETQTETILAGTHCEPPEGFVIASEDMIGKAGVWAHFGGWNFTKAAALRASRSMKENEAIDYLSSIGLSENDAQQLYAQARQQQGDAQADAWISPWPGIGGMNDCSTNDVVVQCADGLNVNLTTYDAWYNFPDGRKHPASLIYPTPDGRIVEKVYDENIVPQHLSTVLIPTGRDTFRDVLADPALAAGMFVRMFYLEGHGLEHFSLLTRQRGLTSTDVFVWKAKWEGGPPIIMDALVVKKSVGVGDTVVLNYIGSFEDGAVFDSSITNFAQKEITSNTALDEAHQYNPLTIVTGTGSVIQGFEEGLLGAALNEEKIIVVPPELGYTVPGHPLFNRTLTFRIRIVDIR